MKAWSRCLAFMRRQHAWQELQRYPQRREHLDFRLQAQGHERTSIHQLPLTLTSAPTLLREHNWKAYIPLLYSAECRLQD